MRLSVSKSANSTSLYVIKSTYEDKKHSTKIVEKLGTISELQKIYHELSLDSICRDISEKYKFDFDLNSILSRLVYSRIIFPSSKHATYILSKDFLEQPNFDLHQIYRALEVIAKEMDLIQSALYKNSLKVSSR